MFSTSDTIVAIATPLGRGGIGVVRVSGAEARRIAGELTRREQPFEPRHATFARVNASDNAVGDQVVVTVFPSPHSYTGEDVAEISAHGSPVVLQNILNSAIARGARLAEPGEFTLRAFLNGKVDLIQAEAVADLIAAVTPLQARAAYDQLEGTLSGAIASIETELFELIARLEASLDFPDEGYHFIESRDASEAMARVGARIDRLLADASRGRLVREGAQVAIVGAPNVGKSSLFNALLNANRAIVTDVPGTTRDLLAERADIRGMSIALVDTAGIRDTLNEVEREGVRRARGAAEVADLVLLVMDRSRAPDQDDAALIEATAGRPRIAVLNKIDLPAARDADGIDGVPTVKTSVRTGSGLDQLATAIVTELGSREDDRDRPLVTNVRHATLLRRARAHLRRAVDALDASNGTMPEEFLLADLQQAAELLQEISGRRTTDDLLGHIFATFCIGK